MSKIHGFKPQRTEKNLRLPFAEGPDNRDSVSEANNRNMQSRRNQKIQGSQQRGGVFEIVEMIVLHISAP